MEGWLTKPIGGVNLNPGRLAPGSDPIQDSRVSEVAADPQKKAVCRGLTAILKESPVASSVDPKSFFMMLNTNYSALATNGTLDLGPLFEALRASAPEESLLPLFAKFEERSAALGLTPRLPPSLEQLPPEARAELRQQYDAQRGLTNTDTAPSDAPDDEAAAHRRRVVNTFVQGFRASPLGQRMDPSQLSYFIGGQIDDLLVDGQLRVEPIVDALRQQSVNDADIYVGVAMAGEKLKTIDVELQEPTLDVRPEIRSQLLRQAQVKEAPARARPSVDRQREEERKKNLEEFELPAKKRSPGRARVIRVAVMLVAIVGIGAFGYLTRPNRELGTRPFVGTIPLASAQVVDGAFSGVVDWETWSKLPAEEQRRRAQAFEALLKERGLFTDFQIRGPDDQVLAVPVEGSFRASPKLYSDFEASNDRAAQESGASSPSEPKAASD